jgi:zinc and cadmium transporter
MSPPALLAAYCVLILLASLSGGWIPHLVRLTHTRLQVATSFVGGLMLGVGVLHLLPHAWQELKSIDRCAAWLLAGFLVMFLIQRFFHFHHHDVPDEAPEGVEEEVEQREHARDPHEHCAHDHTLADKSARHLSWTGAAFGLTLHTLIDGFAVAASVEAEGSGGAGGGLLGLGTFLVVILHKPFDAMAIATLMTVSGWSKFSRHVVNALFALAIPVGMLLFHFGAGQFSEGGQIFLGAVLAFTAGTFICIAASDLLPELQFHAHDRVKLTVALIAGLAVSAAIGAFETTGHDHENPPRQGMTNDTHATSAPAEAPDKH